MMAANSSHRARASSLLENRILVFFALLLVLLGGLVLAAQYWAASRLDAEMAAVGATAPQAGEYARRMMAAMLALMVLPVGLALLAARAIVRRAIEPLKELTRVADEISTGNLDPRIDFGVRVNCWEIKDCQRTDCKAYMNLAEQCWYIDGTPCEGYEPRFPQKLEQCRTCEVYRAHRGDEIVQLADAFRHMANVLKASRGDLIASDDFQKRLIRNSFDGIIAAAADGTVTIFNRVAAQLTGYTHEEVVGRTDWRVFFEDGLEKAMDTPRTWERVRRVRGFPPRESAIKHQDGHLVDVRLSGISLYERGRHVGRVFFFQDLREIHRLKEELIQSERLAATGQAAASISHSLRNILDGAGGGLYVFRHGKRLGDEGKMDTGLDMIERNVGIISDLVKDLLNFAKERTPDYEEVDPRVLIEEVLSDIGAREPDRIELRADVAEGAGTVMLDVHAFRQCLGNLIHNALESIPPDRTGTVSVGYEAKGDRAVFTVSDDGEGMSAETIEKVRGGMHSTKGSKGTGLGLLVIQKIVTEHRGALTILSEEGKGSTFRIEIPAGGLAPHRGPDDKGDSLPDGRPGHAGHLVG
jgi:PAS domain S-box-containing protein